MACAISRGARRIDAHALSGQREAQDAALAVGGDQQAAPVVHTEAAGKVERTDRAHRQVLGDTPVGVRRSVCAGRCAFPNRFFTDDRQGGVRRCVRHKQDSEQ